MKVKVYTDGGCSPNPGYGGYACLICFPKQLLPLSGGEKYTTNNRMELQAVVVALEKLVSIFCKTNKKLDEVEILSDSNYVVNGHNTGWMQTQIKNNWITKGEQVKNQDLWKQLIDVMDELDFISGCKITFTKVKGHSGNYFNERCDQIVKEEIKRQKDNYNG